MSAWMETSTGRAFYLREPEVETGHLFTEIAPALARIPRFNGHTIHAYSVAQHSVLCAQAAEDETGDRELAAYCLLHDAHEAYTGDITRPMAAALAEEAEDYDDDGGRIVHEAAKRLKKRIDIAIARAAGLEPAGLLRHRGAVASIDLRALRTERDDLMFDRGLAWDRGVEDALRLPLRDGRVRPWGENAAHAAFIETLQRLCPSTASAAPSITDPLI